MIATVSVEYNDCYKLCDVCGEPSFYDGLTSYEGPEGAATVVALCARCAQTHRVEIVAKDGQARSLEPKEQAA
ncbi:hypothetical protein [Desulfarculus baarsii]